MGGREVRFFTSGSSEPVLRRDQIDVHIMPAVQRGDNGLLRPIVVKVQHAYVEPVEALLKVGRPGPRADATGVWAASDPPAGARGRATADLTVTVEAAGQTILRQEVKMTPVRHWELYFLPHSHVDIGYTHVQTEVERKQWEYLRAGDRRLPQHGRLSARGTLQVERRSAVGRRQLPDSRPRRGNSRSSSKRCASGGSTWTGSTATS